MSASYVWTVSVACSPRIIHTLSQPATLALQQPIAASACMPRFKRTPVAVLADARSVRASELARRNRHNRNAAAPRLPNRSSRGWHQAPGIGANRTAGARGARGAWVASAWAASGWDGDRVSSRPLLAKEVRLVLSSSVAHYETAVRRLTNDIDERSPCHVHLWEPVPASTRRQHATPPRPDSTPPRAPPPTYPRPAACFPA